LGGAKGRVKLPSKAVDGTAKGGLDFEPIASELEFEDEQTESVQLWLRSPFKFEYY